MSDPEHNKLQLSTKRFAQPGSLVPAAIRMNVDGLHGYYYLAEEGMQDGESDLLTMDHPFGEGDGENRYRNQAGTTICVRLNLYQLGGFRTLKELVDRYVQFPEVRVEYFGQEGHVVYPTQGELMAEVHALNPGGVEQPPKEHSWYISDEEFARLKREHPEIVWENDQRPGIAVKYCPLDWMAPGDQVSGVAVIADVIKPKCHIQSDLIDESSSVVFSLSYKSDERKMRLVVGIDFSRELEEKMKTLRQTVERVRMERKHMMYRELLNKYPRYHGDTRWCQYIAGSYEIEEAEIPQCYHEAKRIKKEYGEMREKLDVYERVRRDFEAYISYTELSAACQLLNHLPDCLQKSGQKSIESRSVVAFNGILADQSQLLGKVDGFVGMILLLQQRYRPEVNLARDMISELPLEALAVLSVLQRKLRFSHVYRSCPEVFQASHFCLRVEEEFQSLLEEDPALKDELRLGAYTLREAAELLGRGKVVELSRVSKDSLYDILCLAAAKKLGTVYRNTKEPSGIYLCNGTYGNSTTSFPPSLFIAQKGSNATFGVIDKFWGSRINSYNPEHPVSQWLIRHQRELIEKVPGIYNALLEDMVMVNDAGKLCEKFNAGLRRLQSIPGNPYEVTDSLFLKKSDFA